MNFYKYNDPVLIERRKKLRYNLTESERFLWEKLRGKRLGFKFFRQYGVKQYILDFYCPEKRLAIEVDGFVHRGKEAKEKDQERTNFLNSLDIKVVRFWDSEVINDIWGVIKKIEKCL